MKKELANAILFSFGKLASLLGTAVYTFAIGLYVLKTTGSGLTFAVTLVCGLVPVILVNPLAGVFADRKDKKTIVVAMDLANGLLFAALYLASGRFGLSLPLIYGSSFLAAAFTTFFAVSMEAAKPGIVSPKRLLGLNTASKIIDSLSAIGGPMVGGLVFAWVDIRVFILANGASYLFSAFLEHFIDFGYQKEPVSEKKESLGFLKDFKEGLGYIAKREDLLGFFVLLVSLNFAMSFSVTIPLPYIVNEVLALPSQTYGFIQSAFPVGVILGALRVGKIMEAVSIRKLLGRMSLVLAGTMGAMSLPLAKVFSGAGPRAQGLYFAAVMAVFGIVIAWIDIPLIHAIQTSVPESYRGRVLSMGISLAKTASPLGLILSGILAGRIPVWILPLPGALLLVFGSGTVLKPKSKGQIPAFLRQIDAP